jgi:predicted transcriptional regulator
MKLVDLPRYGPVHRFGNHHVYRTLMVLSDQKRKGRKHIADAVGIGEGSMRTIIEYLRGLDMIDVRQTGIKITRHGNDFLSNLPIKMANIGHGSIALGQECVAVQMSNNGDKIKMGVEQRDSAIMAGAEGATTIVVKEGKLIVPPDYDLEQHDPALTETLRQLFNVREGDAIIVGTASTVAKAEDGALAAAFDLL